MRAAVRPSGTCAAALFGTDGYGATIVRKAGHGSILGQRLGVCQAGTVLKTGIEYEYADRAKDTGFSLNTFSLNA